MYDMLIKTKDIRLDKYENTFGISPSDFHRLRLQGTLLKPIAKTFLLKAGLQPGMKVIDLGSGSGEFSCVAAEIIGDSGILIGFDKSHLAIKHANMTIKEKGLKNVKFELHDILNISTVKNVDAIIGRFILSYLENPSVMIKSWLASTNSIPIIAFQEWNLTELPEQDSQNSFMKNIHSLIIKTLKLSGINLNPLADILNETKQEDYCVTEDNFTDSLSNPLFKQYFNNCIDSLSKKMIEYGLVQSYSELEHLMKNTLDNPRNKEIRVTLNPIVGLFTS